MSSVMANNKTTNKAANQMIKQKGFAIDLKTWGPFVALVVLALLGVLINPAFLGLDNLSNMLTRSAFIGIIAIGATFVITAGGLDLSVGAMAAFIAGVMIILMNSLVEQFGAGLTTVLFGVGASLLLGLCAGFINGMVTTKGKIEAFIVTLGTMGIYRSLVTYLADGGTLTLDWAVRDIYRPMYYGSFLGITIPVWVFICRHCWLHPAQLHPLRALLLCHRLQ